MTGIGHVVVTGGVGALGLAIAERLLDEGCSVTVLDADGVEIAVCTERFAGEDILFLECDVSDEDEVADALEQAAAGMGPVSGLVNCAGLSHSAPLERTSAELFRQIVEVNLTGAFITAKAALDEMTDRLAIVNVSAPAATQPDVGDAAYGAAKAGVHVMSRVMAKEVAGSGVRVNVVVAALLTGAEADNPPAPGACAEVAAAVLFLLSDEASGINGQIITVGDVT